MNKIYINVDGQIRVIKFNDMKHEAKFVNRLKEIYKRNVLDGDCNHVAANEIVIIKDSEALKTKEEGFVYRTFREIDERIRIARPFFVETIREELTKEQESGIIERLRFQVPNYEICGVFLSKWGEAWESKES